ncbi:hypothetical protein M9Y10_035593 [Tritrichomonas musculus]|uniref:Uncharacterized protein n=1 Tax=Tritrichomonas musculus TaxID=1915356 RepID=A0ABR2GX03_9EUKA
MTDSNQKFTLTCNENAYEYPADTFARVSKKCAALVKVGEYRGKITHPVSDETFEAFSKACKLEPFKVTIQNAWELYELAEEWQIPSLETFVKKYIDDKGIKKRDVGDPLGDLIMYLNEENKNPSIIKDPDHSLIVRSCIHDVGKLFNQYLTDERLGTVHPEVLFKIMMATDPSHINQQLLIDFAMKLFENEPEKAVPLCLRIDFDLLTDAQIEEIFQCREIHEQAMGYFIADSMSAIRNKEDNDLELSEERYMDTIQNLKDEIANEKKKSMEEIQNAYETEIRQLEELAQRQAEQIETLKKLKEDQIQMLQDEEDRFNEEVSKLEDKLHNLKGVTEERQAAINERQDLVKSRVATGSRPVIDNTNKQIDELRNQDEERRKKAVDTLQPMLDKAGEAFERETKRVEEITETLDTMSKNISESFATLAAKVVDDQFRSNYFLRDIQNKYEIFNSEQVEEGEKVQNKIWGLTAQEVEDADKNIVKRLQSNVTEQCPLNVHHQILENPENPEAQNN